MLWDREIWSTSYKKTALFKSLSNEMVSYNAWEHPVKYQFGDEWTNCVNWSLCCTYTMPRQWSNSRARHEARKGRPKRKNEKLNHHQTGSTPPPLPQIWIEITFLRFFPFILSQRSIAHSKSSRTDGREMKDEDVADDELDENVPIGGEEATYGWMRLCILPPIASSARLRVDTLLRIDPTMCWG